MSAITTHVLDTSLGRPARDLPVRLEVEEEEGAGWRELGAGATDADGRLKNLLSDDYGLRTGHYRLTFDTGRYFETQSLKSFYPHVVITFLVHDAGQHYHVPLLLSPYGYSTYRGS